MFEELGWTLKRWMHRSHRVVASLRLRGWASTWNRITQALARRAPESANAGSTASIRTGNGPRMLVLDACAPDPSRDSGSLRMYSLLQLLGGNGWQIDFFADDGSSDPADARRLADIGVAFRQGDFIRWFRREAACVHTVVLSRAPIADQYLALVRKLAPHARIVFDTVDLHFLRERRAAELVRSASLRRRAEATFARELKLIRRSDLCLVVSEEERRMLSELAPGSNVELLSNIHQVHGRSAGFEARRDLLFVGGFSHPPNLDAMRWFIADVFPRVRQALPDVCLHIVGQLTPQAGELRAEGVQLHGRVEELAPFMDGCRVSIAPLRFGAGVKGKVNMAMSHGVPVVLTSIAAEGMHLVDGENALIADSAEEFAAAIVRLYGDPALWVRLSDGGLHNVATHFSTDLARRQVLRLFPH
ncbi:glycosyltransferase family 4 protein [Lysobacter arvi]|uniref:Glycosyltransferase family 4 protein n=1 Tax=Lysobacter arvi TaxID=3038776 RepID=A0ABU1CER7_9GAMM|nr:glycosyltransferase family 4 protein [Lysobacter arvi]MDR0183429.1 glycosyltransferase family 4 protein [Lysobacter arvi]